jgi:hypothetical protein
MSSVWIARRRMPKIGDAYQRKFCGAPLRNVAMTFVEGVLRASRAKA